MRIVRNRFTTDWEYRRFLTYLRDHRDELLTAGEALAADDLVG